MEATAGAEDEMKTFNEDIVCTHGISPNTSIKNNVYLPSVTLFFFLSKYLKLTFQSCILSHNVFASAPGALSILETERKLVSTEVWTKLREYFPRAPEFTHMQEPCRQCLVGDFHCLHLPSSIHLWIFFFWANCLHFFHRSYRWRVGSLTG